METAKVSWKNKIQNLSSSRHTFLSSTLSRIFMLKTDYDQKRDIEYFKNNAFKTLSITFIILGIIPIITGISIFIRQGAILAAIVELLLRSFAPINRDPHIIIYA